MPNKPKSPPGCYTDRNEIRPGSKRQSKQKGGIKGGKKKENPLEVKPIELEFRSRTDAQSTEKQE